MKKLIYYFLLISVISACSSSPFGQKVKEPFKGSSYETNNRFFRAQGKGESSADNVARSKADVEAKGILAGQINTTMKQVSDQYLGQTQNDKAADVADKFQSLVREVMNTDITDLRKIGEEKYFDKKENKYTVFIAYEIKKSAMIKTMKQRAKASKSISKEQEETLDKILQDELNKLGDEN